jgi:hypothetical protein
LLYVSIPEQSAQALLTPIGQNRGVVTWQTVDRVSVSFLDGLLVASRGLGFDLMSSDVEGTRAALSGARTQNYSRFHSHLGNDNRTQIRSFSCSLAAPVPDRIVILGQEIDTVRRVETCKDVSLEIQNTYWTTSNGSILRSRQWLSEEVGYLETELIRP